VHHLQATGPLPLSDSYPQREIARSAYEFQRKVEQQQRIIVGINQYQGGPEDKIPTLKIDLEVERSQKERIVALRARRNAAEVARRLDGVRQAARDEKACLFGPILEAVKSLATLGEICQIFREEFGEYSDPAYC
jgi:methylmalonyl-CoA mutase N-terminal domain/subunit